MGYQSGDFAINQSIVYNFGVGEEGNIITLIDSSQNNNFPNFDIVSVNSFIKNFRAKSAIISLDETPLPDIGLTDSPTQKLYKALDTEWGSPRMQLDLLLGDGMDWANIASLSLLNPNGYPYRSFNLLDLLTDDLALELGTNGKLGVRLINAGFGVFSPGDELSIFVTYVKEVVYQYQGVVTVSSGTGGNGLEIPSTIKNNAELTDYLFMVDNQNQPYLITKANFLSGYINQASIESLNLISQADLDSEILSAFDSHLQEYDHSSLINNPVENLFMGIKPFYQPGRLYCPPLGTKAVERNFWITGELLLIPFFLAEPKKIDGISFTSITANVGGTQGKIATYQAGANGLPTTKITDFDPLDLSVNRPIAPIPSGITPVEHPVFFYVALTLNSDNVKLFSYSSDNSNSGVYLGVDSASNINPDVVRTLRFVSPFPYTDPLPTSIDTSAASFGLGQNTMPLPWVRIFE